MIEINSIVKMGFKHYITARIDIKNKGNSDNKIKFLHNSDENSFISFPKWFFEEDGQGAVIQSYKGSLNLKIKCINDGKLDIRLRGIEIRNKNEKSIPIFINFLNFSVNGYPIIDNPKLVSYEDYHRCEEIDVLNGDVIFIHVEWSPFIFEFTNDSLELKYDNASKNIVNKNLIIKPPEKKNLINFKEDSSDINKLNKPKVSIIIPIYNPGKLLYECLDSVINQSMKDIEIICVDDGSTDDSLDILNEYALKDNRFKIFHQKNKGAGTARNKAIDESTGEFIIFLDSDDWIEKDMCEKLYNHAQKLNVDLVIFDALWHTIDGINPFNYFSMDEFNEDYNKFTFDYHFIKNRLMTASYGVIWSRIYRSSYIKNNHIRFPKHKIYNDVEFCFKTAILAKNIAYYPKPFYHYIKLGQPSLQTSFREGKDELLWFDVLRGLNNIFIECNVVDELRLDFINYCIFYSFEKLKNIAANLQDEFLFKLKSFFEILNPNKLELNSIKDGNLTWYTSKTLEYLPLYYEVRANNFNHVKLKLYESKLNEFKKQLEEVPINHKEEIYHSLKEFIFNFKLSDNLNKRLSKDLKEFCSFIINSNDYSDFIDRYLTHNVESKKEIWYDVDNSKSIEDYTIYEGQPGILSIVGDYKELKVPIKDPTVVRAFSGILNGNLEIQFEIKVTDYANIGISSSDDVRQFTFIRISNNDWLNYKFLRVNNEVQGYISTDGISWESIDFTGKNLNSDECQFQFNCGYSDAIDKRIMIRNIKIYQLS